MTELVKYSNPIGKAETLKVWRSRMRMPVPTAAGQILDLRIVSIYETTSVNGLPLDLLIDAQKTKNDPVKQFGVIFSESPRTGPSTAFQCCGIVRVFLALVGGMWVNCDDEGDANIAAFLQPGPC